MATAEKRPVDIIIDTDAANETDDQFAISYALLAPERLNVLAVYAAPFLHCRVNSPAEGMFNSYWEIRRFQHFFTSMKVPVFYGATDFLDNRSSEPTQATSHLIELARQHTPEQPLHIVAIAALTNIAAALLLAPDIADRLCVSWLGSHSYRQPPAEFNLEQDLLPSTVVFNADVPLRLFPCLGVAQNLTLCLDRATALLRDTGELGEFLLNRYRRQYTFSFGYPPPEGKMLSIWDLAPFAALMDETFAELAVENHRHIQREPLAWREAPSRRQDLVCQKLAVEAIFEHFRACLERHHRSCPVAQSCNF